MENEYELLQKLGIWIGSTLTGSILALVLYIRHQHRQQIKDQKENAAAMKENLVAMITAMANNTKATESTASVMIEMKVLMHTVKDLLLKGGKHK